MAFRQQFFAAAVKNCGEKNAPDGVPDVNGPRLHDKSFPGSFFPFAERYIMPVRRESAGPFCEPLVLARRTTQPAKLPALTALGLPSRAKSDFKQLKDGS